MDAAIKPRRSLAQPAFLTVAEVMPLPQPRFRMSQHRTNPGHHNADVGSKAKTKAFSLRIGPSQTVQSDISADKDV